MTVRFTARAEGKHARATSLSLRALRLLEKAEGSDHPDVANVLNTLAGVHEDQSEYPEAERLYQRAVKIMENAVGDADVEQLRIQSLRNLAGIYRVQGKYKKADLLYRQALAAAQKTLGPTPPDNFQMPSACTAEPYQSRKRRSGRSIRT
jgi:tetratricopeptide (TPR) repeat protein